MAEDSIVILMPVFNDWKACEKILGDLDTVLAEAKLKAGVLIVDDGSTTHLNERIAGQAFRALRWLRILRLRTNLGHQRAIGIALPYIEANVPCEALVLMDSDGEDDPRDVPRLLGRYQEESKKKIVFAERTKRVETCLFRTFYFLYRMLHVALTGHAVRVGNFSVIPRIQLKRLVAVPELWSHYAAAVFFSKIPYCTVSTKRAKRVDGKSKMNFVGLVIHGMSSISVFSDVVGVRMLLGTFLLVMMAVLGIASIVAVRLFTNLAIPGWATYSVGLMLVILLQAGLFGIVFVFIILSGRKALTFLPARDYTSYVEELRTVYESK